MKQQQTKIYLSLQNGSLCMTYLVLFHTHLGAIKFELLLEQKGLIGCTKPVPRKLSSSCGVCNEFTTKVFELTDFTSYDVSKIYRVESTDYHLLYDSDV